MKAAADYTLSEKKKIYIVIEQPIFSVMHGLLGDYVHNKG